MPGLALKSSLVAMVAAVAMAPAAAQAQIAIARSPATGPDLGTMVRGSGATTFNISNSGMVTRTSGNGIRISNSSVSPSTITISCGFLNVQNLCALRPIRVTIQPVASSTAYITQFTVGSPTGNLIWATAAPPPASSVTFDFKPLGLFGTGSFTLGMDVWTAGGVGSGTYTFDYTVTASFL